MTLNTWTGLQDPEAPKNLRKGDPYDDPKFEDLARTYGIWGTAQAALCAQFWLAARRAPVAQVSDERECVITDEMIVLAWNAMRPSHRLRSIEANEAAEMKAAINAALSAIKKSAATVAQVPPDHIADAGKMGEAEAELGALRNVYECARGVLRYDGVDEQRFKKYRDELAGAIESVKTIDAGYWEPIPAPSALHEHSMSMYASKDDMLAAVLEENEKLRALLATGGQAQSVEKSATHGMNLGQRIRHVGGRENAQTYIEFGSVSAVRALVDQVLRDLPDGAAGFVLPAPQAQADARDAEWLQPDDMAALERFAETTDDDQSYDIGKEAVKRLAHFGCVESFGFGRYGITAFGSYILGDWARSKELPFKTQADRDAESRAAIAAAKGE